VKRIKLALCAIGLCLTVGAAAGGGGLTGGATEMTQMMNNAELIKVALDSAQTASTVVQKYATQLQQLQLQMKNIQGLGGLPGSLSPDTVKALSDLTKYHSALTALTGSLSQQSTLMDRRLAEARLGGTDWASYVSRVGEEAASGNKRAIERLRYEQSVLEQVQSDYAFARQLQDQIPATVGQHQALQLMNSQMNRVVTQNAKLIEVVSASLNRQAREEQEAAEGKAKSIADRELLRKRQEAVERRQRAFGGFSQ